MEMQAKTKKTAKRFRELAKRGKICIYNAIFFYFFLVVHENITRCYLVLSTDCCTLVCGRGKFSRLSTGTYVLSDYFFDES